MGSVSLPANKEEFYIQLCFGWNDQYCDEWIIPANCAYSSNVSPRYYSGGYYASNSDYGVYNIEVYNSIAKVNSCSRNGVNKTADSILKVYYR